MSNEKVLINKDDLVSLANSIRLKSGSTNEMTVIQMKVAVDNIDRSIESFRKSPYNISELEIIAQAQKPSYTDFSQFTQCEFIRGTGTQYLQTDYLPNDITDFEIDVKFNSIQGGQSSQFTHILASRYPSLSLAPNKSNFMQFEKCPSVSSLSSNQTTGIDLFVRHTYAIKNNIDYVDDVEVSRHDKTISQSVYPLYIFACNDGGNLALRSQDAEVYGCKIWENSVLVRDYKPCYHKFTREIGLFDVINNKFIKNAGSGYFLKGNDII